MNSAAVYGRARNVRGLGNDVRGLLRTSQDLLDLGFKQSLFLMVVRDLLKNLRVLQLSFQHILLIALAYAGSVPQPPPVPESLARHFSAEPRAFAECRPGENRPS